MIKRVVEIKNVGTFRNSAGSGNTNFTKLTLIHAENGRGKTTLCAVLRSLRSGDPMLVLERKTLDSEGAPNIKILTESAVHDFKDGKWTVTCPYLEIFDAGFIADNVYSGDSITHDHKRNLCKVVLGAEGVKLAAEFDRRDALVKEAHSALQAANSRVSTLVPKGMTLEAFIALPPIENIDNKIESKEAEISRLKNAEAIRAKPSLALVAMPQPPATLTATLERTLEGVSSDAEARVRDHIVRHKMGIDGEKWLGQGLAYVAAEECPLCAQDLKGNILIAVFRAYFSKSYTEFHRDLATFKASVEGPLSSDALLGVQKAIEGNATLAEFWKAYIPGDAPTISFENRIEEVIRQLRDAIMPLVNKKLASPLEKVTHSEESLAAIEEWKLARGEVREYAKAVESYNARIATLKDGLEAKNLPQLTGELAALRASKSRYEPPALAAIQAVQNAKTAKASAEVEKATAKDLLDKYNAKIIGKYHAAVNHLLARFGAAFRLDTVEVEYKGRTPRVGYSFALRGRRFHPGSDTTPAGEPCFGNTLSSGDRNVLALAFFIAQIKERGDVSDLIVVFDDPFTSLDSFRQSYTCASIRQVAGMCKQVVVLSHSLEFLKKVSENCGLAMNTLKIEMHNKIDSKINYMDLNDAVAPLVEKDVTNLRNYVHGDHKDHHKAIRAIRPLLENYISKTTPDQAKPGTGWLGGFLANVRTADASSPLAVYLPDYEDLNTLNEYTAPYHHDPANCPPINEAELVTHATLALKLIGRS